MNRQAVKAYLDQYKANFKRVHLEEIYKWQAIKQFQDTFDVTASDFHSNLKTALSKTSNLMDSGQYFPRRMILKNAERSPEKVRSLFEHLYDEELDRDERINFFSKEIKSLNQKNFGERNDYQDHRAIMVYLTLRYPERYFFYKFEMFRDFVKKVDYPTPPVAGRLSNIGHFQTMCELVRAEITADQELLKLHKNRIGQDCYYDKEFNLLTQDFIYAVVKHLGAISTPTDSRTKPGKVTQVKASMLNNQPEEISLAGRTVNFRQRESENKRIGDLGELWVVRHEKTKLEEKGKKGLVKKIKHAAKDEGDGLGYDILSFSPDGQKKYIEVKTTKGPKNTTFYLTRNELERSRMEKDNFYLYRVYNYNEQTDEADLLIIQGGLENLCTVPLTFKVDLKNGNE